MYVCVYELYVIYVCLHVSICVWNMHEYDCICVCIYV